MNATNADQHLSSRALKALWRPPPLHERVVTKDLDGVDFSSRPAIQEQAISGWLPHSIVVLESCTLFCLPVPKSCLLVACKGVCSRPAELTGAPCLSSLRVWSPPHRIVLFGGGHQSMPCKMALRRQRPFPSSLVVPKTSASESLSRTPLSKHYAPLIMPAHSHLELRSALGILDMLAIRTSAVVQTNRSTLSPA